jgi:hypothetical protein
MAATRCARLRRACDRRKPSNSILAIRSTVVIGSTALTRALTASLSHSVANPCTSDHAASSAPPGSLRALASRSVATPRESSAPAAANSPSEASTSDLSNITR